MNKEEFYKELYELENKFKNMQPELELTVREPKSKVEGYVVVWNTDISVGGKLERCGKGGTRITAEVSLAEVKMLARKMALKNAAAGLPLGGAKSGMKANPDSEDFEERYKKFVNLCKPILFENGGIFGGFGFDIGAREPHPKWACDALGSTKSFTGKPLEMGGTDYDKEGTAGLGVATAAKIALEIDKKDIQTANFTVQGIGAMGAAVVRYFSEYGGKLFAISDPRINGTWIFGEKSVPTDIIKAISIGNIDKLNELLNLYNFEHTENSEDILYIKTDILFPCAVQNVITSKNSDKIKARYIVEGANSPCTPNAHRKLFKNNITVIPDFIANSGGIIAAYVELTSDASVEDNIKNKTKVKEAKKMTIDKISKNVQEMLLMAKNLQIEPPHAGMYLALKKILNS